MDATGLTGQYDFDLYWVSDHLDVNTQTSDAPTIRSQLQSLGLKLEPSKQKFDIVVIDHVESTPTEN